MEINQNRLDTFRSNQAQWPHSNQKNLEILKFANAGFFLVHNKKVKANDLVKCFLCDVELSKWKANNPPFSRHSTESPSCPWVLLGFPDHRMLTAGTGQSSPKSLLMRTARAATFSTHDYWPPEITGNIKKTRLHSVTSMAEAGFYYSPTLEHRLQIKCPYCHFSIKQPNLDINLLNEHKKAKPECPFTNKHISITKSSSSPLSSLSSTYPKKSTQSNPLYKKRKVSETSTAEDEHQEQLTKDLDGSIWNIDKAFKTSSKHDRLPRVLQTYSKKKKRKSQLPPENILSSLLTFPTAEAFPEQNMLDGPEFSGFSSLHHESVAKASSQKGKEKEHSIQEQSNANMSRISLTRKEQELNRYSSSSSNKVPERVSILSSSRFEAQERTVPISPFRQSKPSLSTTSSIFQRHKSRSRESSQSSTSSTHTPLKSTPKASTQKTKDNESTARPRQVTPPPPSQNILSKRALLMQSTPNQSSMPRSTFNLFDDDAFSPIVGNEAGSSSGRMRGDLAQSNKNDASATPLPFASRTHGLIDVENQQIKPLVPPKSPTRTLANIDNSGDDMIMMVKELMYENEFTEEEKKMTVAEFIKATIEKQIDAIKKHGEQRIEDIRKQAEKLKRDIINS